MEERGESPPQPPNGHQRSAAADSAQTTGWRRGNNGRDTQRSPAARTGIRDTRQSRHTLEQRRGGDRERGRETLREEREKQRERESNGSV